MATKLRGLKKETLLATAIKGNDDDNPTHEKGTKEITRSVLNMKEILALDEYVVKNYVESALTNEFFIAQMNCDEEFRKKFRFDVKLTHLKTALDSRDIPHNYSRRSKDDVGDALGVVARVQALEEQVKRLATTVAKLLAKETDKSLA